MEETDKNLMIYLLLLILIFGLIQSFLELKKDKKTGSNSKWSIEKMLSILYVLGFIVGFVLVILQNRDSQKSNRVLDNISFSVKKIDSSSLKQIKQLSESFNETKRLLRLTDSMNRNLKSVIEIRNSLIAQTDALNRKLSSQLANDLKTLKANQPVLSIIESDMKWIKLDSFSRGIYFCIRNLGNRSAFITLVEGSMLFFNKENQVIYKLVIPRNTNTTLLQPTNLTEQRLCQTINRSKGIEKVFGEVNFAGVYMHVKYKDIVDNSIHKTILYSGWNSKFNDFGTNKFSIKISKPVDEKKRQPFLNL